jgi:hypothetical protein
MIGKPYIENTARLIYKEVQDMPLTTNENT